MTKVVLDLGDCDTASVQADGGARAQRFERVTRKSASGKDWAWEPQESVPVSVGRQASPFSMPQACVPLQCTVIQTSGTQGPSHPPHSQRGTDLRSGVHPHLSPSPVPPLGQAFVISPTWCDLVSPATFHSTPFHYPHYTAAK